jgi:hypothetical protein
LTAAGAVVMPRAAVASNHVTDLRSGRAIQVRARVGMALVSSERYMADRGLWAWLAWQWNVPVAGNGGGPYGRS